MKHIIGIYLLIIISVILSGCNSTYDEEHRYFNKEVTIESIYPLDTFGNTCSCVILTPDDITYRVWYAENCIRLKPNKTYNMSFVSGKSCDIYEVHESQI